MPSQTQESAKDLKLISARAIKKQITNNGVQGISAQTVQAINAMVDELLHKIALESYRIDTVLHLSQNAIRQEIKGVLTQELAEAVTEAMKVMEYEATSHLKKQQWEALIFQDMASDRLSTRPATLESPNAPNRRFLIPYHRVYHKLDSYCERREDRLNESTDGESERGAIRFREDPHFSPTSVVFITCALEYVVAASLKAMCDYVKTTSKDVIKMEDMLTALQSDAMISNMFSSLTISNRLKRKISTHKHESTELQGEQVPAVPVMDNAIKLESLLDNLKTTEAPVVPSAQAKSTKHYQVRQEPSLKDKLAKAQQIKAGQATLDEVSDEVHTRNTLLDLLAQGNGKGVLTADTKQRSHSFVDLVDVSSPQAQRVRQSAAALFLKANPKPAARVSELEQQRIEAVDEKKFRSALVEFLVKGDGSKKAVAILKNNSLLEKSQKSPALAKSENNVQEQKVEVPTGVKKSNPKMISRSAVTSTPDIEFDSEDEFPIKRPKQTLADFLRDSGPEPTFVPQVQPMKKLVAKIDSRNDRKKMSTEVDDDENENDDKNQESLADFLSQTSPPNYVNPVITISQHDVANLKDEPKRMPRIKLKAKIDSRKDNAKMNKDDSDDLKSKKKLQSMADFLNESGPAVTAITIPRLGEVKTAPENLATRTTPRKKLLAKAEPSLKKKGNMEDGDEDEDKPKRGEKDDLMAFLAEGPAEPIPTFKKGRRTSTSAVINARAGGFLKSLNRPEKKTVVKPVVNEKPKAETSEVKSSEPSPALPPKETQLPNPAVVDLVSAESTGDHVLIRAFSKSTNQLEQTKVEGKNGSGTLFRQKVYKLSQKQLPVDPAASVSDYQSEESNLKQLVDSDMKVDEQVQPESTPKLDVVSNLTRDSTQNSVRSYDEQKSNGDNEVEVLKAKIVAQDQELEYVKGKLAKIQSMFDELSERAFKQIQDLIDERDMLKNLFAMWSDAETAKLQAEARQGTSYKAPSTTIPDETIAKTSTTEF